MNKKICFIGAGLNAGGQERHLTGLANYFAKNGYQVLIINLFKTKQFFELDQNIEIFWPKFKREEYNKFVYALMIIPYIRKIIKKTKPNVILSFGEWFSPFVIFSTRFLNTPVFSFEMMGPNINLGKLVEYLRKITYKYAQGIIMQTSIAANIIEKNIAVKNIIVVPTPLNPINTDTNFKKKQIVTVGRLSKEKGHKILLHAFSNISQKDFTLHLIGDGPEREFLKKEAVNLQVSDRVIFHGFMNDFSQIMGESEVFVLPSFYEGFPNALIEAMSVPLACISSNCVAGPSDIIEDGVNGLLVETGNVDALTNALNWLIENPDLRNKMAVEAYKIRETLAFDKIANKYLEFIFR